ncbi:type II toxin-antitoxin system HipA family toxin [Photobacterium sp. CAU 1568]|uniref:Type II toxin-antitoxin system HipA family toxin n=1 Tax=Photobacterium arenosum TaxID=2774143 RepID=A0ABR9BF99_9GAMM|nr:type II toxin-antitoxin system HipA family toxin [Photobacterium arenosum]MBD8511239.1 type II toxin-antitoxin system HipA family toxin [Photobacterium arenosum]
MVKEYVVVKYQGRDVGAATFDTQTKRSSFEYDRSFIDSGLELSPLMMPLGTQIYQFPNLDWDTFRGMSGLLADSLPDDFGNAVLNSWVARNGKQPGDITPLQRLQYTGERGMGALTYSPAKRMNKLNSSNPVEVQELVSIAQEILDERTQFGVDLNGHGDEDKEAMLALMSVGMSAGGARPKAVLAFNKEFTEARSGQTDAPEGFTHWLLKFDGVSEHNKDRETFGDPLGYGAGEFTYYQIASELCGIEMMPTRLLQEGDRRHFVTQRFDRVQNKRVHTQTLNGIAHVNFKRVGEYSYEELFAIARRLKLKAFDAEQLFRRMVFNVVARNHDDHSKNWSFMMSEKGEWTLAPAYDLAYSYKKGSKWVNSHWMSLNGKRDNFTREDFHQFRKLSPLFTREKVDSILDSTIEHVSTWRSRAQDNGVPESLIQEVGANLRLKI